MPKVPKIPKAKNVFKHRRRFIELHDDDNGFSNEQFERPPSEIPYKSIVLAIFLFVVGSTGIIIGALIETGYIQAADWLDRGMPFLILGLILFIPGSYHVYLAWYAWHNTPGYDFGMIPDLD
ncbi:UPF0414 transmembrane protein C20orf30 [Jimgerdemannia flammicorona]|uniref:Transmembrane protein 230 n=1 Tax=Jimgerdemannia flammicorona TaxID=994334 RepID=A0A433QXF7_9FUNG|nr:UPF0414 transmembrane protein C20orf30 [Jimgerdemannia flammicorona]